MEVAMSAFVGRIVNVLDRLFGAPAQIGYVVFRAA